MELSEPERAVLAGRLFASLALSPAKLKKSWAAEAQFRFQAFKRGEMVALDGPETLNALKRRF
ncbi:addiction module protein [Verrucomicrobium spinosum]|uniref:addiction module protein n=1 Tax=Verrucomicrobium spinosum TaxID=2736 RepID=UPI0009D69ABD